MDRGVSHWLVRNAVCRVVIVVDKSERWLHINEQIDNIDVDSIGVVFPTIWNNIGFILCGSVGGMQCI
jgi:hypothetical protein